MSKELETLVELKRFIHEFELGNVDKLFVDGSCDILEKALNTLNLFRSALTLETIPLRAAERTEYPDGSISVATETAYNYVSHELDKEAKKALTTWVVENIDKDTVRKWLADAQ